MCLNSCQVSLYFFVKVVRDERWNNMLVGDVAWGSDIKQMIIISVLIWRGNAQRHAPGHGGRWSQTEQTKLSLRIQDSGWEGRGRSLICQSNTIANQTRGRSFPQCSAEWAKPHTLYSSFFTWEERHSEKMRITEHDSSHQQGSHSLTPHYHLWAPIPVSVVFKNFPNP